MKKKALLLVSVIMILALNGCSLFTSGSGGQDTAAVGSIPVSDSVTHEDPTDLDFVNRYVYYSGEVCTISEMFEEQYGAALEQDFFILYSDKDDKPLRAYYYFVFADESGAETVRAALKEQNYNILESAGNTVSYTEDQEDLEVTIDSFIAMNVMEEKTGSAYADMYCEMYELTEYNPE